MTEYVSLPYYGAAKGHVLEITRNDNGIVSTKVIQQSKQITENNNNYPNDNNGQQAIPSRQFGSDFVYAELSDIQKATADILSLQERVKLNERLTKFDHKLYLDHLNKLSQAGTQLVTTQQQNQQPPLPQQPPQKPQSQEIAGEVNGMHIHNYVIDMYYTYIILILFVCCCSCCRFTLLYYSSRCKKVSD